MKVLLVNGSPHKDGCTFTALSEVASELNKDMIETEIFRLKPVAVSARKAGTTVTVDQINIL